MSTGHQLTSARLSSELHSLPWRSRTFPPLYTSNTNKEIIMQPQICHKLLVHWWILTHRYQHVESVTHGKSANVPPVHRSQCWTRPLCLKCPPWHLSIIHTSLPARLPDARLCRYCFTKGRFLPRNVDSMHQWRWNLEGRMVIRPVLTAKFHLDRLKGVGLRPKTFRKFGILPI